MLPQSYNHLNNLQKGCFGEAYTRMAFTLANFEVYTPEYDDRGIDFVARNATGFYFVQVKTTGQSVNPFIYEPKFTHSDDFVFAAVRLIEQESPRIFLARRADWTTGVECLNLNTGGGEAGAYYEFRFANKYTEQLAQFEFSNYVTRLGGKFL